MKVRIDYEKISMPNVNNMMKRVTPDLKKLAGNDKEMFETMQNCFSAVFNDMATLYREGTIHKAMGQEKLNYFNFVASHNELAYTENEEALPIEYHMKFVSMLYGAYVDGYDGVKR